MQIAIDMSLTAETKTGLPSYARSLVAAMARQDKKNDYLLYPFVWHSFPPQYERAFCPKQANFRLARRLVPKCLIRHLWKQAYVDKDWLIGGDPDVYFSPFHSVPPRHFRRLVSVFHDISFRIHPEFSTEINRHYCEEQFDRARRMADKMITVSHFSKAEMVKHMGVPKDWIRVTHEAADPRFKEIREPRMPARIATEIGSPAKLILYVGSVEPRKNLITLIKAFDLMLRRGQEKPLLIIAGGSGWKNSHIYEEIEHRGLGAQVYFTGFVTDEELVALYNLATVFVYPTIYEGFGLPVIEAMSSGTPVITTRVASIPEVGGDAVCYVDEPTDEEGLGLAMEEVLGSVELREELRRKGLAQAATFTWEKTARETLAVIQEVHEDPAYGRRRMEVGQDERALGKGWYEMELESSGGGRAFRWTKRQASLQLIPGPGKLVVEASSSVPGREQVLGIRVNGRLIGQTALDFDWQTFSFPVDKLSPPDQPVEVSLDVNFDLPPSIKGTDHRQLGARVTKVLFE